METPRLHWPQVVRLLQKAHPAHPGTSGLVARAIVAAIKTTQCHPGTFALLQGQSPALSEALVAHPHIKAVGFTDRSG